MTSEAINKYIPRAISRPALVIAIRTGLINCGHSDLVKADLIETLADQIMQVSAAIQREDMVPKSEHLLLMQKLTAAEGQVAYLLGKGI